MSTESPEELRQEIEQTREELGDTVEALAEKTDLKKQAKHHAATAKEAAQRKREVLTAKVRTGMPESAGAGAQLVTTSAKENPVPLAAGAAFILGYLAGRRKAG